MKIYSTPYQYKSTPFQGIPRPHLSMGMKVGKPEQNPISFKGFWGGGVHVIPEPPKENGLNYLA